jgi:precorrin-3B synthase
MAATSHVSLCRSRQKASPCPGLFRIVQSKDGGICRIKLPFGRVDHAQVKSVADGAARFGNGQIELTNRANFQIRGIDAKNEESLIQILLEAGLGPKNAEADDIRNVMVSGTMGLDRTAVTDVTELAARILAFVEGDSRIHALSPKLSILVDGGEEGGPADHPSDLWLSALPDGRFACGIAGRPPFNFQEKPPLGVLEAHKAFNWIVAALETFVAMATSDPSIKRFRDVDVQTLSQMIAVPVSQPLNGWFRARPNRLSQIGVIPQHDSNRVMVGGLSRLGRVTPETLTALADLSLSANGGKLRLTPWSGVLLADVEASRAAAVLKGLSDLRFLVSSEEPLAQIVACSGTTGCASAVSTTKEDAGRLAGMLAKGRDIHLTACPKSCASARVAEYTLVALDADHYDLYQRQDGIGGFGRLMGQRLELEQTVELLT